MSVDVCIVTKNNIESLKGLERQPINQVIIERSKPLGKARQRAIEKVDAEWFAFVDDDVELSLDWYKALSKHLRPEVGAVSGYLARCGYGETVDKWLSQKTLSRHEYKLGERWTGTHHGLIRTSAVKDWTPSKPDLSSWEDYDLTQHILRKGLKVVAIPHFLGKHKRSLQHMKQNVYWNAEGMRDQKGLLSVVMMTIRYMLQIPRIMLCSIPLEVKKFHVSFRLHSLLGCLKVMFGNAKIGKVYKS